MIGRKSVILSVSVIAILVASSIFVAFPATPRVDAQAQLPREQRNWEMINNNALGGNYNPQTQINKDNVALLELKWVFPFPPASSIAPQGFGLVQEGSETPPLVVDGILYAAMNSRSVLALDAATGKVIWRELVARNYSTILAKNPHIYGFWGHTHALDYYADKNILMQSYMQCVLEAQDALTGKMKFEITNLCGTADEAKAWGNQGLYGGIGSHPPQFFGNIMVTPVMGFSTAGGRSFIAGYDVSDMNNPKRVWQTFLVPPGQGDPEWALRECDKGWFFNYPDMLKGGKGYTACKDVPRDVLMNDWIDPTIGKVHTASTVSAVWGHMPVDPETGIVYIGTGEIGPYYNASRRPGPNLYGSSIVALDARTGKMVWWFQSNPHDLWDWDCSWGGILGKIGTKKVLYKACKDGFMYALDAATGEPVWIFNPPNLWRINARLLDPTNKAELSTKWIGYPERKVVIPYDAGMIEHDPAYDGKRIYVAAYNYPIIATHEPLKDSGPNLPSLNKPSGNKVNTTVWALDATTGKPVWSYFIDGAGFRGGLMVSGGVLYGVSGDGTLHMWDADTGKEIFKKSFGVTTSVMPTIGATASGKMQLFAIVGGGGFVFGSPVPGAIMAFGLPDKLPEPQVITKEVIKEVTKEVVKEVIKEVPKEVVKEVVKEVPKEVTKEVIKEVPRDVIKEVPKEVTKTVTVETVSPITYVGLGIAVIIAVVGVVVGMRRKPAA